MKNAYWYFLAGMATVLAPVGIYFLMILMLAVAIEGVLTNSDNKSDDIAINASNASPNEKYIATTSTSMGGGAAGWCSRKVNVRRIEEEFNQHESVFNSSCGAEIKTEWQTNDILLISYKTKEEMLSLNQKGWNADKTVKIIYMGK